MDGGHASLSSAGERLKHYIDNTSINLVAINAFTRVKFDSSWVRLSTDTYQVPTFIRDSRWLISARILIITPTLKKVIP